MNSDEEFTRWFAREVQPASPQPVPYVWVRALNGDISIEEAARQRQGLDSEEEIAICKRLYRPQPELESRRHLEQAMAQASVRPASQRWALWVAPALACAAALLLFFSPRRPYAPLPHYDPPEFTSQVARERSEGPAAGDRIVHHRVNDPVRWKLPTTSDDSAHNVAPANLRIFVTGADHEHRALDLTVQHQASGSFIITASSLGDALGPGWLVGDLVDILFVVTRPGVAPPRRVSDLAECDAGPEILCTHVVIKLE